MSEQQRPYANLGCGRVIYPGTKADHHAIIADNIFAYPKWVNIDRNPSPGVDCVTDLFRYPWPFEDNSWDGALLSHLAEHVPHEIRLAPIGEDAYIRAHNTAADDKPHKLKPSEGYAKWIERHEALSKCQDGWYAFFAELHRCLTPGAYAHILSPYGWSDGAITDPTHTRYLTERTFTHSMQPDPNSPFEYQTAGLNFQMVAHTFGMTPFFAHLAPHESDSPATQGNKATLLTEALATRIGVVSEIYVKLEAVK